MGSLIKNELVKLFGKKTSYLMQLCLIICLFLMALLTVNGNKSMKKYMYEEENYTYQGGMNAYQDKQGVLISEDELWQVEDADYDNFKKVSLTVPATISLLEKDIQRFQANPKKYDNYMLNLAKKELAYYQAYDEKGIDPIDTREGSTNADFFSHFGSLPLLATLLVVIVASTIVAVEFSKGTIKLLLIRPYSRTQILLSKYVVTLFYGLITTAVMVLGAAAFSFMLPSQSLNLPLAVDTGAKTALTVAAQLAGANFLLMILYITIAFFFSAVIRSQSLALGVGMSVLFLGNILGQFLPSVIAKYDWLKWLLFNLLGLSEQVLQSGYETGGNLSISATVFGLIVYIIVILLATIALFNKRDVALS